MTSDQEIDEIKSEVGLIIEKIADALDTSYTRRISDLIAFTYIQAALRKEMISDGENPDAVLKVIRESGTLE